MKKILVIESSPRGKDSVSRKLTAEVVAKLRAKYPGSEVTTRDLSASPLPHVGGEQIQAYYTPVDQRTPALHRAIEASDAAIDELIAADIVVIGYPMWNFGFPSVLKSWVDHIVRAQRTFSVSEAGYKGLLPAGKKAYIAKSSGGVYSEGPMKAFDFGEPHIKGVLGFIGIEDVRVIRAEGLNDPRFQATAYEKALKELQEVSV